MSWLFDPKPLTQIPEDCPLDDLGYWPSAWAAIAGTDHHIVAVRFLSDMYRQLEQECLPTEVDAQSMPGWIVAACAASPDLVEKAATYDRDPIPPDDIDELARQARKASYWRRHHDAAQARTVMRAAAERITKRWTDILGSTIASLTRHGTVYPGEFNDDGAFMPIARIPGDEDELDEQVAAFAAFYFEQLRKIPFVPHGAQLVLPEKPDVDEARTLRAQAERELLVRGWVPTDRDGEILYCPERAKSLLELEHDEFSTHEALAIVTAYTERQNRSA